MKAMSKDINGVEYILMKDIKGNEDLHEIARNIKFEDDTCLMPKNTTRKQFIAEIKSEIEWYFDFVSPPVNKDILNQEYLKILKIEEKEVNKYILKQCAKFDLRKKTSNKKISEYYKQLTSLDNDRLSIKDKRIYLYNYIVNDMIKDEEITQQQGEAFMNKIKQKIRSKLKER